MKDLSRFVVLLVCLYAPLAVAADFDVHGFLTQGFFKSDKNNYFGKSSEGSGSFDFHEYGVNPSAKVSDDIRLSALFLVRQAGGTDNDSLRVDHALADVRFFSNDTSDAGVLLGRIKTPIGFYNETRDVAITRPSILLPQSIYFDQNRNFLINADGAQFYWELGGKGTSYSRLAVEAARTVGVDNPETEFYFLGAILPGELDSGTSYGFRAVHERDGGRTKFAMFLSTSPRALKYSPAAVDILQAGTVRTESMWLSFHQDIGDRWGFTSELFMPRLTYEDFGPFLPDRVAYPLGYYVEAQFRPAPKWETFIRRDISYLDRSDKDGTTLAALTGRPAHNFFAKDDTIGARYHLTPKLSLSAEIHSVNGTVWLPIEDNPDPSATSQYWKMLALQVSYTW